MLDLEEVLQPSIGPDTDNAGLRGWRTKHMWRLTDEPRYREQIAYTEDGSATFVAPGRIDLGLRAGSLLAL